MENKVKKLLKKHQTDRDLTSEKIEPGWDWSGADLTGFNLKGLELSISYQDIGFYVRKQEANFEGVNLTRANLEQAQVQGANFKNANLFGAKMARGFFNYSDFTDANLQYSILDEAKFIHSNLTRADLSNAIAYKTSFSYAIIDKTKLYDVDIKDVDGLEYSIFKKIDESDSQKAIKVYLNLEKYYKLNDCPDQAGQFYYKRKILRRRLQNEPYRFLSFLFDLLCGYGEKPYNVLIWWFVTISLFAIAYGSMGGPSGNGETDLWDSLYFSGVTFTTLGFGDLHPDPGSTIMKLFAAGEAFIGAFLMSLFVVCLTRKLMR